jgi:uncharacterized RDD family membrane protein YckC
MTEPTPAPEPAEAWTEPPIAETSPAAMAPATAAMAPATAAMAPATAATALEPAHVPPVSWSPPPTVVEVPNAPGLVYADVSSRLVAFLLDGAIVGMAGAAVVIALGLGERVQTATSTYVWVSGWAADIAFALLGALYFVFFWTGGRRATVGQRAFDIQVGNAFDGRPLRLDQAVRRWIGYGTWLGLLSIVPDLRGAALLAQAAWWLVLIASMARSPARQALHDRFARSALVRPASRGSGGAAMACLVIVIVAMLLLVVAVVALIYLGSQVDTLRPPAGTAI